MGAAIAVGELYDMAALGRFLEDDREVKSYLESFGIRGLEDVDALIFTLGAEKLLFHTDAHLDIARVHFFEPVGHQ